VLIRHFTEKLTPLVGKPFIVDYKVGANGNIALEYVAKARPDGYTLLMNSGSSLAASLHLFKNPVSDVAKDFQIAATINRQTFLIAVDPKSPYTNLAQLTAAMKAKGNKASYATTAPSGVILGSLYRSCQSLEAVDVAYRDAASAFNDMLGGNIEYMMVDPVFALSQADAGKLRLLAAGSDRRINAGMMKDIPTLIELGCPSVDVTSWWVVTAPKATPRPIIDKLNAWYKQILSTPETAKFLNGFGGEVWIGTPEEGQARRERDFVKWGEMIRFAKIQPFG
jgi:tripartite-type tricarboxylate transporter receptor subunit TctC